MACDSNNVFIIKKLFKRTKSFGENHIGALNKTKVFFRYFISSGIYLQTKPITLQLILSICPLRSFTIYLSFMKTIHSGKLKFYRNLPL